MKRQPNNAKIKVLYNQKRNEVNQEIKKIKKNHFIKYSKKIVVISKTSGLE